MGPAYKRDELLKMRQNSKVGVDVIRKINSEAGIREHVIRDEVLRNVSNGSEPAPLRKTESVSSFCTNPWSDDPDGYHGSVLPNQSIPDRGRGRQMPAENSKYSPTPSIKRGKAERLVKEHGSPPGMRVTAGGRIVQTHEDNTLNRESSASNTMDQYHGNSQTGHYRTQVYPFYPRNQDPNGQNPLNTWVFQNEQGQFIQAINGIMKPVHVENGNMYLYAPAPNFPARTGQNMPATIGGDPRQKALPIRNAPTYAVPINPSGPDGDPDLLPIFPSLPTERDIAFLRQHLAQMETDLKDLNRNEVLQKKNINNHGREAIAKQRVALTVQISDARNAIKESQRLVDDGMNEAQRPYAGQVSRTVAQHFGETPRFTEQHRNHHPTNLAYFSGTSSLQPMMSDRGGYQAQYAPVYPPMTQSFQAQAPFNTFDPNSLAHNQPSLPVSSTAYGPNNAVHLTERAGNAGLGNNHHQTNNIKQKARSSSAQESDTGHVSGNFQRRRSHAITIKSPPDHHDKEKSSLDPTSPSYFPSGSMGANVKDNKENHALLPAAPIQDPTDNLINRPSPAGNVDDSTSKDTLQLPEPTETKISIHHQPSDASIGTVDFFPHETSKYSLRNYSKDESVKLSAWMVPDKNVSNGERHSTPAMPPNKFVWKDSPEENLLLNYDPVNAGKTSSQTPSRQPSHNVAPDTVAGDLARLSTEGDSNGTCSSSSQGTSHPSSDDHPGHGCGLVKSGSLHTPAKAHQDQSPVSYLLNKASEKASALEQKESAKSTEYLHGFRVGIQMQFLEDNTTDDFRRGYRDGMVQAAMTRPMERIPSGVSDKPIAQVQSEYPRTSTSAFAPPPAVPANTTSNTPTRPARSPADSGIGDTFFGEALGRDYMSQPNVTLTAKSTPPDKTGILGLTRLIRQDPPSPLSTRNLSQSASRYVPRSPSFVARMQEQRYTKSKTSVAASNKHAQGYFPPHTDGFGEDDKPSNKASINLSNPSSPPVKAKPLASPGKFKASAAVAKFEQLIGSGHKKDQEGRNKTSPNTTTEKKERRHMFKPRIDKATNADDSKEN